MEPSDSYTDTQRWRVDLAYDGRPFHGWQSQPNKNAVQDHLESALSKVCGIAVRVHGAGRTDRGVHADLQVAHFDAPVGLSLDALSWQRATNAYLVPTIRVMAVKEMDDGFHARFSPHHKTYCYRICRAPVLPPLRQGLVWHFPQGLDTDILRKAVNLFEGRHDFAAFSANRGKNSAPPKTTVREVRRVELTVLPDAGGMEIRFTADGFLYKMVRLMMGTAVRCACGRLEIGEVRSWLDGPGETSRHCAPPDGLYLERIAYGEFTKSGNA